MTQRTSTTRQPILEHPSHRQILDEILRRWPGIEHDPEFSPTQAPADQLAIELLGLHPVLIWGDEWACIPAAVVS